MKLIVGLGNPGNEYEKTKHNVGFWVIDKICEKLNLNLDKNKFEGIFVKNEDYIIAKPMTYMNNSGSFVREISNFFKINIDDILVIYDDMDFEIGQASIKNIGSAGGHNGMKDIIEKLNTNQIKRLKIGISRDKTNIKNYVLSPFAKKDEETIQQVCELASDAAIQFLFNDIRFVIEKFNGQNRKKVLPENDKTKNTNSK